MKKKICDHPAGILFAVIVALLIAFFNYYTMGNVQTTAMWFVAIFLLYFLFCLLCKTKENENEKDK